ncbi:MAG: hypothetical protein AMXMBFR13_48130 [Phycisphaerae bacterium]
MSRRLHFRTLPLSHLSTLAVCCLLSACNGPPAVNPWCDDSIPPDVWTTPSEQGILMAAHEPALRARDFPPSQAPMACFDVPHYPLWWEDPFEDKGDGDHCFMWTWQDYFAMPYSYARMHLNTLAWPVSAAVTPPGARMVSDGCIGRDHDAARGVSPDPTATLCDLALDPEGIPPLPIEASPITTAPADAQEGG